MPDNDTSHEERRAHNGEILKVVQEINTKLTSVAEDVAKVKTTVEAVQQLGTKHEQVLYGDPEEATSSGLINRVKDTNTRIEHVETSLYWVKTIGLALWAFITFGINVAISLFRKN